MGNQCVAKQLPPIFLLWFLYPLLQEGSSSGCPVPSVAAADPGPCMTLSSSCCSPELHSMAQRGTAHWTQLGTILLLHMGTGMCQVLWVHQEFLGTKQKLINV